MSGHSKWHNIQAKKGKADAARGKIFTKLGREILIAVKQGGPDPAGNSKLKDVISKCKANNMPNDTINNAIKKASGATDTSNYEEITYEGYGTNGVAVIVEASTDNRNRTAADVRHVFDKAGGNLGTTGCVSYLFNKKGIIVIDKESTNMEEDDLMMLALDAGAEDFSSDENCYEITTAPADFSSVRDALEEAGISHTCISLYHTVTDERKADELNRLIKMADYVTFASSSAVRAFVSMVDNLDEVKGKYISIGPVTTKTAQENGLSIAKTAVVYTARGMVETMIQDAVEEGQK